MILGPYTSAACVAAASQIHLSTILFLLMVGKLNWGVEVTFNCIKLLYLYIRSEGSTDEASGQADRTAV
jgi:hypothetical protein